MKTKLLSLIFMIMAIFGFGSACGQNASYDQLWKQVKEADRKDHPKTVVEICDKILEKARKENNRGQMLKAYFIRAEKQIDITPDTLYTRIQDLEKMAATEKDPATKMVIHSCIASIYSNYARGNAWNINSRTNVDGGEDTPDVMQWGSIKFTKTILENVDASLSDMEVLRKSDNSAFIPFVEQHRDGKYFNHDLLHILVSRAVESLFQAESIAKDRKAIEKRIEDILNRQIATYKNAGNTEAYILSSLNKIVIEKGDRSSELYLNALEALRQDGVENSKVSNEILISIANALESDNPAKAIEICEEGIRKHPDYDRNFYLKDIKSNILKPYVNLSLPQYAYTGDEKEISLRHKNSDKVTLIFYRIPESLLKTIEEKGTYNLSSNDLKKCEVHSTQSFALSRPEDYKATEILIKAKMPSRAGVYTCKMIADKEEIFNWNIMRVGKMKLLYSSWQKNKLEVIAVDRITGQPIEGANVILTLRKQYRDPNPHFLKQKSDKDGKVFFEVNVQEYRGGYKDLKAEMGEDKYMPVLSPRISNSNQELEHAEDRKLTLISDRSIYRPGQTVYIKGIEFSEKADQAKVTEREIHTIVLKNSNREVVDKKDVITNSFGSFETSLTIPTSGLMGNYTIETDNGYYDSQIIIRVEEYKRPTFEVKADRPEETFSLGDKVEIKATAKTFSGIPVDQADVSYTLSRRKWRFWSSQGNEILETGQIKTDDDGVVKIPVTLTGEDDQEDSFYNSYYSFELKIDVTNLSGETQSTATSVYAGKKSLITECSVSSLLCKEDDMQVKFNVSNLSHNPIDTYVSYSLFSMSDGKKQIKVREGNLKSNTTTKMNEWKSLPSGKYRLEFSAKDPKKGEIAENAKEFTLFSIKDERPVEGTDFWTYRDKDDIYFGTSHKDAVIYLDVYADNKLMESKVFRISDKIEKKTFNYRSEYKDGACMVIRMVRNDRLFQNTFRTYKPTPDHNLKLKWSTFRNTLIPGQKEVWKMTVVKPDGTPAEAEVLTFMYDASLDKIYPYYMNTVYHLFPRKINYVNWITETLGSFSMNYSPKRNTSYSSMYFDSFINIPNLLQTRGYYGRALRDGARVGSKNSVDYAETMALEDAMPATASSMRIRGVTPLEKADDISLKETVEKPHVEETKPQQEEGQQLRTNFNETAFFLPQLVTDKDGNVSISFSLPESLTRWRFRSMAHTKDLMTGYMSEDIEARKDFMISPFMPRFLRNGDKTTIASTLNNLSEKDIEANVKFELFDPATEKVFHTQTQKVRAKKGKTAKVSFTFDVVDTYDVVGVRIVAEGGQFSDGEQHLLAVLSDKVRLVESVALPIRGNQTKEFSLEKLFNHHSPTATKKTLTIEFTGNPAWYAVQALPSLAEPDDDCAICWTNALYANTLASKIANSQPKIKNVYESWKKSGQNKETLLSNLQKNQELKTILLSESPWVLEAKSEEDQKNMISTLFDVMSIGGSKDKALKKLQELQMPDGGWTWFKGMTSSPWITEYVLTQDIRLRILTGEEMSPAQKNMHDKGLSYMHEQAQEEYDQIKKMKIKDKGVSYFILKYFYLISLEAQANGISNPIDLVPQKRRTMYNYFLSKVAEVPKSQDMQEKAMAAVVLKAHGKQKLADEYMQSIREHLTSSDEMGMYFAFNENPYRWGSMNLNAQVAAIEAFDQVAKDIETVEEMKIWLLKQKQTQMWGSSPMTADAVFALLARGENWLKSEGNVDLTFAGKSINTTKPDEEGNAPIPGLNYIKRAYTDNKTIDAKTITVSKKDSGIAWGAAYATFFEKISNVKNNGSKEMSITKELFVKRVNKVSEAGTANVASNGSTNNGALAYTLEPLKNGAKIKVGDIVTARMVIKVDRKMDFVQLKEQRAACFEPMSQLSGYRWGGGTGYYEEIKDAATSFFFYSLGKGTYVLEVNYRASRAGEYEAGLATLQCAYAPEYTAHTGPCRITVTE